MATTAASPVFLDTNVLIYATVTTAPFHSEATVAIRISRQAGSELWISRQILREYLAVLTRPQTFAQPIAPVALATQVRLFERRMRVADENARITAALLSLLQRVPTGGRQVHDANIVATMQAYGITQLLTHNVGDFARYGQAITVLPLVPSP